jgi:hypothetical protein
VENVGNSQTRVNTVQSAERSLLQNVADAVELCLHMNSSAGIAVAKTIFTTKKQRSETACLVLNYTHHFRIT